MPREVPLLRNEVIFVVGAVIFSYCAFLYNPHGTLKVPTQLNRTYDYIVVGGGTAGCVLASRLSEHDSKSVLILESGDEEQKLYYSHIPASVGRLIHSKLAWRQHSVTQKHCCAASVDQQVVYVRGNVLGGSGVLDLMIYDRGHPGDYEQWAVAGNVGWSYEDLAHYFVKAESFDTEKLVNSDSYGQKGPVHVSKGQPTLIGNAILEAAKLLGYEEPGQESNDRIGVSGFRFPRQMVYKGVRQSTIRTYLRPVLKRKNLHVVAESRVTKIDFDKKRDRDGRLRTTGVTFQWKNGRVYHASAAREVILAAGALSTPYILMESGLGQKVHLQEQNIEVKEDLPVLGKNLVDHPTTVLLYSMDNLEYINHASQGFFDWLKNLYFYYVHGSGPLTTPPVLLSGFFRSGLNPDSERPDLQLLVTTDTSIVDPKIIQNLNEEAVDEMGFSNGQKIVAIIVSQLHTKSTGSVKIKHQQQHNEHDHHQKWTSEVDPNFYDDDQDVKIQARGLRIAINIMESEPMKKFNPKLLEKPMNGCKQGPKFLTDQYLQCIARKRSFPSRHQSGTCKMGVDAQISVVDSKLRVHGVGGLRIADASVFPSDVSANSNIPTIMLAEKAADLIKEAANQ